MQRDTLRYMFVYVCLVCLFVFVRVYSNHFARNTLVTRVLGVVGKNQGSVVGLP